MAEEGKGVAMAILGIVAVIAVVGLVLLFTGATGKVSAPYQKLYGGVNYGEQYPYLVDRTAGGFFNTAGTPDSIIYEEGALGSEAGQMVARQDEVENPAFAFRYTTERSARNTPAYNVDPCVECSGQGEYCIVDPSEFSALKQVGHITGTYPCAVPTGTGY